MKMHYLSDPAVSNGVRNERDLCVPGGRFVALSSVASWLAEGLRIASQKPVLWLAVILIRADVATLLAYAPSPSLRLVAVLFTPFAMAAALSMQERSSHVSRWSIGEIVDLVYPHRSALLTIGLCCVSMTYLGHLVSFAAFHLSVTTSVHPDGVRDLTFVYATHTDSNNSLEPLFDLLFRVVPISLMWFAPALVVLNRVSALNAMAASARAVARNWPVACVCVAALVSGMLLASFMPMIQRALVLTPLISGVIVMSLYTSYRSVFGER